MKRRGFLAALAALPFVGRIVGARRSSVPEETILYYQLDDRPPTCMLVDPFCQDGQVIGAGGVLFVSPALGRRLPRKDAVIEHGGARFTGWTLTGKVAPGRDYIGSLVTRRVT